MWLQDTCLGSGHLLHWQCLDLYIQYQQKQPGPCGKGTSHACGMPVACLCQALDSSPELAVAAAWEGIGSHDMQVTR